ncbi:hypothetical protein BUALT_Bualt08G0095600 [Buddleja alternifolia]|uniref:Ubiquitin-like domain-containing protein n=1 Tax=Buddleja alternifolia TaxID=168488 RepID=A0AAV6X6H7_9LAMI|nr:hypothetical protein BUALT_Bualt08G0095600 [Buddleja alternifolia]
MAESQTGEGSSEVSESTLLLNIKTLDSRVYSFHVDKNIVVSVFKEKIASQSGVPVGQQRLIFRGKVLKDNHPLSEYNVENGDTLHLVERQPQPSPGSNSGEATSNNDSRGQDPSVGGSRNRVGHIAHSIVLGTLNVGDPGESAVPDISRVIGAVLNSIGIGNQAAGMQPGVQTSRGNETEGLRADASSQNQGGNQYVPWQAFHGQSAPQAMQIPMGAAIAVPSLNLPIPDSLNTLVEFMNSMELAFSQNGNQPNQPPSASGNLPTIALPSNSRGLPTVEALSIVLQHAQRLLSGHAVPALSHTAGRLAQEGGYNDLVVRGQVQTESVQLGIAMQHLGALLLELGRTILTLRMGQSPAESFVNAGPAVYISPSGPNPIMVQPFPLQTSSLFGGSTSAGVSSTPVAMGPVGVGSVPRNVNIHIHTGASMAPIVPTAGSRAPNREGIQGEQVNVTESGDSGQARVSSRTNVTATALSLQPPIISVSGATPPAAVIPQTPDPNAISSIVAELNSQIRRNVVAHLHNNSHAPSEGPTNQVEHVGNDGRDDNTGSHHVNLSSTRVGEAGHTLHHANMMDDQKAETEDHQLDNIKEMGDVKSTREPSTSSEGGSKRSSASNQGENNPDVSSGVPLGLGLAGLQPKKRGRQPRAQSDGASASTQNQQSIAVGQQVLQSLASVSTMGNTNTVLPGQLSDLPRGVSGNVPTARQNADDQNDVADAMSQMLGSSDLDGLLAGVSQQTGVGSPDMLRNMMQQFTQNPAMRNTLNQIAQQVDSHNLGSMFSGSDRGQGGGIDLSRMMQQMMPIVSQALIGVSSVSQSTPPLEPLSDRSRRERTTINDDLQRIDLQEVVQRLGNQSSSEEIFRSLVDRAANLSGNGSAGESVVNELCNQEGLAEEFMEMLRHDISRRFQD